MSVRLAIDIGGTFTDATLIDEETGEVSIAKVLTTPSDPSEGFMQAAERALAEGSVAAGDVTFVVHATTVATNAIIEGKVSVQRAREEYRVAIADRRLDEDATSELRRQPA